MVLIRLWTCLFVLGVFSLLLPIEVRAHEDVSDITSEVNATVHFMPDEEPAAGEPSTLFFTLEKEPHSIIVGQAVVTITNATGGSTMIPTQVNGATISAAYTFPAQGEYMIKLEAAAGDSQLVFDHTLQVTRGVTSSVGQNETQVGNETTDPQADNATKRAIYVGIVVGALGLVGGFLATRRKK